MKRLYGYFEMRRWERIGFNCMLILMLLLFLINFLSPYLFKPGPYSAELRVLAKALDDSLAGPAQEPRIASLKPRKSSARPNVHYFEFDPNGLALADWQRLGLSEKQARVIHNYEAKGGRFRTAADLGKIYSLSEETVAKLMPYVRIAAEQPTVDPSPDKPIAAKAREEPPLLAMDLNTADSTALMDLKGIGPVFSVRIVKYRELLGGYYETAQLQEVYGLPAETITSIIPHLVLDKSKIKRLKINHLSSQELAKHPYISYQQARTIVNYRKQHGMFKSMADLQNILSLNPDFFRKIEFYLDFNVD